MRVHMAPLSGDSLENVLSIQTAHDRLHGTAHAVDRAVSQLNRPTAPASADQEVTDQLLRLRSGGLSRPLFRSITPAPPEPTGRSPGPHQRLPATAAEAGPERTDPVGAGLLLDVLG